MADPFLGEIRIFSFVFPPAGWALCNGQLLHINQNQALFSLFGTTYGGNGVQTFALPNLQSRVPLHFGQSPASGSTFQQGQVGGATGVTLSVAQMPTHSHTGNASGDAPTNNVSSAVNNFIGSVKDNSTLFSTEAADSAMNAAVISNSGGSQPHENLQPYLVLNFCVALQGIFPSRN